MIPTTNIIAAATRNKKNNLSNNDSKNSIFDSSDNAPFRDYFNVKVADIKVLPLKLIVNTKQF